MPTNDTIGMVLSLHLAALMEELERHHPGLVQSVIDRRNRRIEEADFKNPKAVIAALGVIEAVED